MQNSLTLLWIKITDEESDSELENEDFFIKEEEYKSVEDRIQFEEDQNN